MNLQMDRRITKVSRMTPSLNLTSLFCGVIQAANSATTIEMAESESGDKSLKRKLSERGASQGPPDSAQLPLEPLKRPRDDDENSQNRRETNIQSPSQEQKPPKSPKKAPATVAATPKLVRAI